MKRARDYMRKEVVSFGPHDSVFDVAEVLSKNNISGAPVVDGRKVVGMISVTDIVRFMQVKIPDSNFFGHETHPESLSMMVAGFVKEGLEFANEVKKLSKSMVKDFMSKDVVSIEPEATLIEVAETLDKHRIDRLPVIEKGGKLVGIISRTDLLKALLD